MVGVSPNGWLETLTNPADEAQSFTYDDVGDGSGGDGSSGEAGDLIASTTDPRGHTKSYQ